MTYIDEDIAEDEGRLVAFEDDGEGAIEDVHTAVDLAITAYITAHDPEYEDEGDEEPERDDFYERREAQS